MSLLRDTGCLDSLPKILGGQSGFKTVDVKGGNQHQLRGFVNNKLNMIHAKTEMNDIEYIVLPEEIPRNLNTNLRRKFRINKVMENNAKKTSFLYNELQSLFIIYKLFGRFPVRVSKKGNVIISFLSRTSLYAAIVQSVLFISAIWLICETIPLYGDGLNVLRFFVLTESVLVSITAVLNSISMWRDAKHLMKYINGWTEFEVLFKKCTRQELHLGLKRGSKISGIIIVVLMILSPIVLLQYRDFWKNIFILLLTLMFTGGSAGCFMFLWCNNCTALARAGQRLADNFEEYSRNGITPYRLYEYRMAWRKLSSLCDELGDVFSLTLWILNIHAFLGFTLAGYSTVFFLRHLKLKPLAITLYTNLVYGVIMFIQFNFPGRVPNSVTGGMMRELNKISPLSVNEETWREVETFIRVIGDNKAEIHANGFFILNRQLYVSLISTVVTYLLVIVQVEQETWY